MKLSKQERIGVLIIAVIILIVLGIIFLLVPKWEEVSASQTSLDAKQKEYQAAVDKAALKDGLKDDIIAAYEAGRDQADMFFEEMSAYQADQEARAIIQQAKDAGVDIVVEDLMVSEPGVSTLSVSFFDEMEITYPLKTYATQGVQATEDELAAEARREKLMTALVGSQDVGSISVTFEVTAEEVDHLLDFADCVNKYVKEENGKKNRKAVALTGISVEYFDIEKQYNVQIEEMEPEILEEALDELVKKWGDLADVEEDRDDPTQALPGEDEVNEDALYAVEDSIYTTEVTMMFYSIERMQDPADLLDAQDAA